jgi:hypothetical protein
MTWPESESVHDPVAIDFAYAVYDEHPLNESDEWGDLASFLEAALLDRFGISSL